MKSKAQPTAGMLMAMIIVLSLAIRFALCSAAVTKNPDRVITNDSVAYLNSAKVITTDHSFGVSPEHAATPQTVLVPGYPVFLAILDKMTAEGVVWVAAAQTVVASLTIILVYLIGLRAFSPQVGVASAAFLAFDPNSLGISLFVLSETIFVFLLVSSASLLVLSQFGRQPITLLIAAGFAMGLATLTRPLSLYLTPLLLLWLIVGAAARRHSLRIAALKAAAFLLPFVLICGAWSCRNLALSGSWRLSQIEGINLLFFRAADTVSSDKGISLADARRELVGGLDYYELRRTATLNPNLRLGDAWRRQAIQVIAGNPVTYAQRAVRHSIGMMFGPGDGWLARLLFAAERTQGPLGDLRRRTVPDWVNTWIITRTGEGILFLYCAGYLGLVYLSGAVGACLGQRAGANKGVLTLIIVMLSYLIVVSAGPEAYCRFRVPMAPFLCLLAGLGLTLAFRGRVTQTRRRV